MTIAQQRIDQMTTRLQQALTPSSLEIIDDSAQHIGHAGAQAGGGHFTVKIATDAFKDKSTVQCHRLVYDALGEMMTSDIHALSIQIIKP